MAPSLRRLMAGAGALSAGSLLFEVALTRILSLLFFSSYAFVVLSVAVLGIGLGAGLASWRPAWRSPQCLAGWAALAALAAILVTALTVALASTPLRSLTLAAAALPFGFVGLALSTLFAWRSAASYRLYWADLLGAGLGALAALPLLNALGGVGGALAAALLLAGAALALEHRAAPLWAPPVLAAALLAGHVTAGWLEPDLARLETPKPIVSQLRAGGVIQASRWDALGRSDLVYRPDTGAYYLYLDGAAGSLVPGAADAERWRRDIGLLPFAAYAPKSAFLLGPGGGLDLALARSSGVGRIVAAELNGGGVALVRGLAGYTGGLYGTGDGEARGIELRIDEGRSTLARLGERFDLILLSQVITQTAELRGYALSEASVYTVEAFQSYLAHLSEDGTLALKLYDELTLSRALFTAVRALAETGLSEAEAAAHLMAFLDPRAEPPVPLLLVRKRAPTREEAVAVARAAEGLGLALLYLPGLLANPPLDGLLSGQTSLEALVARSSQDGLDLRPARDARPFFFQFERGVPASLRPLLYGLLALLALGAPALWRRQRRLEPGAWRAAPLLFAALGAGFMLLELALIQRSQLLLGRPTLALALVLGGLLVGAGLGSLLGAHLFAERPRTALGSSSLAVLLLGAAWLALFPRLAESVQAGPLALRAAATLLGLAPLALALGLPFPSGLRLAGRGGAAEVALAWSVNGVFSVVGGVAAATVALVWGYPAVFGLGLACYALAAILSLGARATAASAS